MEWRDIFANLHRRVGTQKFGHNRRVSKEMVVRAGSNQASRTQRAPREATHTPKVICMTAGHFLTPSNANLPSEGYPASLQPSQSPPRSLGSGQTFDRRSNLEIHSFQWKSAYFPPPLIPRPDWHRGRTFPHQDPTSLVGLVGSLLILTKVNS